MSESLSPVAGGQFFFPLAIGPQSYSMTEPFTVEKTPTQGGGLYVEENGIVMRTIKLAGTTGFRPRSLPNTSATALSVITPEQQSFGRRLRPTVLDDISGQRHFQYLQDAVFRTYADLKRDPATSEDTMLIFHNPKDEESWIVVPERFDLERTKDDRVLYRYDIEMTVVGKASSIDVDFSEDKSIFDSMKNAQETIVSGLNLARGAVNDLRSLVNSLRGLVPDVDLILDQVDEIISSGTDFVTGVVEEIQLPYPILTETQLLIDVGMAAVNQIIESGQDVVRIPDAVIQKFRQMADGLDTIGIHPAAFETPSQTELRIIKESQELLRSTSIERQDEALETSPPSTFGEVNALGTAITAGDVTSAESERGIGNSVFAYTGATERRIGMGDTLVNLAARYLGDARLWQHIAVINGLKTPFIIDQASLDLSVDEQPFPDSLGIGDTILIPSFSKPPSAFPLLPVLGVTSDESAEVHILGTDLKLTPVGGRPGALFYDVPVDVEGGSTDATLVSGRENMQQAVFLRIRTEKGTDILFKRVGLGRIVGTKVLPTDIEISRIKFMEAINQDSRVAQVRRVDFAEGTADTLEVDADIEIRGFTETSNIKAVV